MLHNTISYLCKHFHTCQVTGDAWMQINPDTMDSWLRFEKRLKHFAKLYNTLKMKGYKESDFATFISEVPLWDGNPNLDRAVCDTENYCIALNNDLNQLKRMTNDARAKELTACIDELSRFVAEERTRSVIPRIIIKAVLASCVPIENGDNELQWGPDTPIDCLFYLVRGGVKSFTTPSDSNDFFFHSGLSSTFKDIVADLLDAGFDPNYRDETGKTALHFAIFHNLPSLATALIENPKMPLDLLDMGEATALQYAIVRKQKKVIKALLDSSRPINLDQRALKRSFWGTSSMSTIELAEEKELWKFVERFRLHQNGISKTVRPSVAQSEPNLPKKRHIAKVVLEKPNEEIAVEHQLSKANCSQEELYHIVSQLVALEKQREREIACLKEKINELSEEVSDLKEEVNVLTLIKAIPIQFEKALKNAALSHAQLIYYKGLSKQFRLIFQDMNQSILSNPNIKTLLDKKALAGDTNFRQHRRYEISNSLTGTLQKTSKVFKNTSYALAELVGADAVLELGRTFILTRAVIGIFNLGFTRQQNSSAQAATQDVQDWFGTSETEELDYYANYLALEMAIHMKEILELTTDAGRNDLIHCGANRLAACLLSKAFKPEDSLATVCEILCTTPIKQDRFLLFPHCKTIELNEKVINARFTCTEKTFPVKVNENIVFEGYATFLAYYKTCGLTPKNGAGSVVVAPPSDNIVSIAKYNAPKQQDNIIIKPRKTKTMGSRFFAANQIEIELDDMTSPARAPSNE
ncbi:MAG: ankyrin repeat domain-containing protein [Tatlockia sp.]|jgi:cell division protein FtsB